MTATTTPRLVVSCTTGPAPDATGVELGPSIDWDDLPSLRDSDDLTGWLASHAYGDDADVCIHLVPAGEWAPNNRPIAEMVIDVTEAELDKVRQAMITDHDPGAGAGDSLPDEPQIQVLMALGELGTGDETGHTASVAEVADHLNAEVLDEIATVLEEMDELGWVRRGGWDDDGWRLYRITDEGTAAGRRWERVAP